MWRSRTMAVAWVAAAVRTLRRSGQAWHKRRGRQPVSCLVATVSMLLETLC